MDADLKLLAIMLEEWPNRPYVSLQNGQVWTIDKPLNSGDSYSKNQWLQARRELGLDQPEVTEEEERAWKEKEAKLATSDGSTASYYELPEGAKELQDLISFKNLNAQMGEIFRACYRYGQCSHSDQLRDAKKVKFYIEAEIDRLNRYG